MDKQRRKELKAQALETKIMMGVYQIKNRRNGKVYLATSSNLKNQWMRQKMQLDEGKHMNRKLQQDWTSGSEDEFEFSVLEEHEVEPEMNVKWELSQLEKAWLEKLQPFDENGYNHHPR